MRDRFAARKTGTMFTGTDSHSQVTLEQRLTPVDRGADDDRARGASSSSSSSGRCSSAPPARSWSPPASSWSCCARRSAFLREVPITEFLFGTVWTPLFSDKHFGVLPLVARHAAGVGDRDGGGAAGRPADRDLPERVRAAPRAPRRPAGARGPRRRADRRLRLLRAAVRHAAAAGVRPGPRRLQRAQPGHRHGHHDPAAGLVAVRGRAAQRAERAARRRVRARLDAHADVAAGGRAGGVLGHLGGGRSWRSRARSARR